MCTISGMSCLLFQKVFLNLGRGIDYEKIDQHSGMFMSDLQPAACGRIGCSYLHRQ
jgi:hypothetical protein